jgi:hypothetical protein
LKGYAQVALRLFTEKITNGVYAWHQAAARQQEGGRFQTI